MTDAERYAITVRKVRIDDEEMWRATVKELPDLAEFAATREEAMDLALDAIEMLKTSAVEEGRPFPEPLEEEEEYSGRVTFRMSKSMHRAAAMRAMSEGVSLNSFIVECVALRTGLENNGQGSESYSVVLADMCGMTALGGMTAVGWSNVIGNVSGGTTEAALVSGSVQLSDVDAQFVIGAAAQFPWARTPRKPDQTFERRRRS